MAITREILKIQIQKNEKLKFFSLGFENLPSYGHLINVIFLFFLSVNLFLFF